VTSKAPKAEQLTSAQVRLSAAALELAAAQAALTVATGRDKLAARDLIVLLTEKKRQAQAALDELSS
jgi:hypothetical protein